MPVDQAEHGARGQVPADQEVARHQQHAFDVRQRRREQHEEEQRRDGRLDEPGPVERGRGELGALVRHPKARAPLPPDHQKDAAETGDGRRRAGGEEPPELQPADLADQDVLRVADDRRRRAGVGAAGERNDERTRIEATPDQPGAQHRRHREHDHVVGQHRGEDPRGDDRDRQQRRGRQGGGRDPHRAPVVEPAGGELGGQDHQPEQDDQRREVDRGQHRCAIQRAAAVEQDRPQERDAGAVDLEPRPAADRHAEVDRREDDEDEAGQADAIMAAAGALVQRRVSPMRSMPAARTGASNGATDGGQIAQRSSKAAASSGESHSLSVVCTARR